MRVLFLALALPLLGVLVWLGYRFITSPGAPKEPRAEPVVAVEEPAPQVTATVVEMPRIEAAQEAGVKNLSAPRRYLKVLRRIALSQGEKRIALYPSDHFKITYSISFDYPLLRHQLRTLRITEGTFVEEIEPARTFGFLKEVETLRQRGLALGGSLENAVVLNETGVLNNTLRFEDEFVRHKILDAIGDLALIGHPLLGHLVAHRGGHALHTAFAAKILQDRDAWKLVESTAAPEAVGLPATVASEARLSS